MRVLELPNATCLGLESTQAAKHRIGLARACRFARFNLSCQTRSALGRQAGGPLQRTSRSRQRALPLKFTALSGRQKLRAKALPVARPGREPPQLSTTWRNASRRVVCRASSGSMGCRVPRHRAGLGDRSRTPVPNAMRVGLRALFCASARACWRRVAVRTKGSRADAIPHGDLIRALSYGCAPKAQRTARARQSQTPSGRSARARAAWRRSGRGAAGRRGSKGGARPGPLHGTALGNASCSRRQCPTARNMQRTAERRTACYSGASEGDALMLHWVPCIRAVWRRVYAFALGVCV